MKETEGIDVEEKTNPIQEIQRDAFKENNEENTEENKQEDDVNKYRNTGKNEKYIKKRRKMLTNQNRNDI